MLQIYFGVIKIEVLFYSPLTEFIEQNHTFTVFVTFFPLLLLVTHIDAPFLKEGYGFGEFLFA